MTDLSDELRRAAEEDGLEELEVRISRYDFPPEGGKKPAAWQAIAKYRGRVTGPWGVGVCSNPISAVKWALQTGRNPVVPEEPESTVDIFG